MKQSKRILITGCSSGVGLELSKLLAQTHHQVFCTALPHSMEQLTAQDFTQRENVRCFPLDVTDLEGIQSLMSQIHEEFEGIDVLVNNAGISYRGVLEEMCPSDHQRQISTNFLGAMELIRLSLPHMRHQNSGHIINVSSVGGMMAMPTMGSYSASKWALEGASESLWYEVKPWNIHVSLIQPGFINSLAFKKVFYPGQEVDSVPHEIHEAYEHHYENMSYFVGKLMTNTIATSESVARKIYRVMQTDRPKLRYLATPDAWVFHFLRRLLPRSIYHFLLYRSLPGIRQWGSQEDL